MSFERIDVGSTNPPATAGQTIATAPIRPGVTPVTQLPKTPTASGRTRPTQSGDSMKVASKKFVMIAVAVTLVLGLVSGGAIAYITHPGTGSVATTEGDQTGSSAIPDSAVKVGAIFGVADEETFADDTEGVLILGGLDGEGSHTLLRPGGVSQNVYLTSSVVDLGQFQNMRIRVWGETFKGQKAGWLMDVGRLEVLELNAELPAWYAEQQGE